MDHSDTLPTMALPGKLEHHHPSDLRLYHRNARQGNVPAIQGSLRTLDQYKPVLVNRGTHTGRPLEVLAGNHTVKAIRDLADEYPSDERWQSVACWVIDVDEDAVQRTVLADNRTAELGGYDDRLLLELLADVDDTTAGLLGTGFDEDYMEYLAASVAASDKAPSLDDLHDEVGDPQDDDDYETVRLRVAPAVAVRWAKHRTQHESDTDALREAMDAVHATVTAR